MSQWRRIALEAAPSCKRNIEEAENPTQMWINFYSELCSSEPDREVVEQQIYDFALRCFRTKQPEVLARNVGLFFEYVVGGYIVGIEKLRRNLPRRISLADFSCWKEWGSFTFSPEEFDEAMKQFSRAKRNA